MAEDLEALTLKALRRGISDSDAIRQWIAKRTGWNVDARSTNAHAWALVHLQQKGLISKVAPKTYQLATTSEPSHAAPAPSAQFMPPWARTLIARTNQRNGPDCAPFTTADLLYLWNQCGGRCSVTGLPFSLERVGSGQAKRVFAPSLDRIEAGKCYSRDNCRLVMVGINFAINSWGLDSYLRLAEAAVRFQADQDPN